MKKYIIREVAPEACDFSFYFEDDGLSANSGDFCNTLFIVPTRDNSGFNAEEYKRVQDEAETIIDEFAAIRGDGWYSASFDTFKECMEYYGIAYNSRKCHALKEWSIDADTAEPETIAAFLSITTGKVWEVSSAHGYCQGDYCEMVYCADNYKNGVQQYGEVWLGAAKEFGVIELDENGAEIDSCYGYIVADCEAWRDEDYKRIVSNWAGIDENDAQLEMIDNCTVSRSYSYRVA